METNLPLLRVDEAIARSLGSVRATAEANGVRLSAEPSGAWVLEDADGLVRVLANLLLNAVWSSPRGAWVRVAVVDRGEEVELRVSSRSGNFRLRLQAAATPPSDPLLLSLEELAEAETPAVIVADDEALRVSETFAGAMA